MNIYKKTYKDFEEDELFILYCFIKFTGLLFLLGLIIHLIKAV